MNFNLNPFAISGLIIIISYFPLFIFILKKGETRLSRIYSLHILSIFIWGLGSFLIGITTNQNLALAIWKPAYIGVIFIPVFFQHAVILITNNNKKILLFFTYCQAVFFSCAIITGHMVNETRLVFNSFYYQSGSIWLVLISFFIWILIVSIAHTQLIRYYKNCFPQEKHQIKGLILAIIGFMGGLMNFFPTFGIDIYPYGNFLVPIHSMIVTYAILRHQLFDINSVR